MILKICTSDNNKKVGIDDWNNSHPTCGNPIVESSQNQESIQTFQPVSEAKNALLLFENM